MVFCSDCRSLKPSSSSMMECNPERLLRTEQLNDCLVHRVYSAEMHFRVPSWRYKAKSALFTGLLLIGLRPIIVWIYSWGKHELSCILSLVALGPPSTFQQGHLQRQLNGLAINFWNCFISVLDISWLVKTSCNCVLFLRTAQGLHVIRACSCDIQFAVVALFWT